MKFIEESKIKTTATKNADNRPLIAEHLITNRDCTMKYEISRFKIIYHCNSVFYLLNLDAIFISLANQNCPNIKKDYKVSLFT